MKHASHLSEIFRTHDADMLQDWMELQLNSSTTRSDLINEKELRRQSQTFLKLFAAAIDSGGLEDMNSSAWQPVRELLAEVSRARALAGFSPSETATFVFSLKQPLFRQVQRRSDAGDVAASIWSATVALDALGLYTTECYQKNREELIVRQQQELLELSTPVITLWKGVLALPMIGTLDSARTQVVMESLLQRIVETGSTIAILDITGVPTVDTLVAQHLLKTVAAARLMGADCIISGIRPQIAQTIVHLGVDLNSVITKATLADAFAIALQRIGMGVRRVATSSIDPAAARPAKDA
jgi:rsbT co-antagonist protein RsbR